jgi:hypothetical protein
VIVVPPGYPPIPPPRVEVVPAAPGPSVVWQPGHWHWNGREYVWVQGMYVRRHAHYHAYVEGHWAARGPNWVWVPGHWQ